MAINVYCGVMGSGKSYEVVSGPLLDAVAAGRRVVTNVDGISEDAVHDYVHERRGVPADRLGAVVHVRTEDILKDGFFPAEVEGPGGAVVTPGFVQPGDLVVVDEAWKLWSREQRISAEHMAFFRMHRHFVHGRTGVACDVVLMIQNVGDLHRSIKAVVELSFRMVKLKSLGLSKGYRVEMYETAKQTRAMQTGTFVRRYKAEIFPLYKSYAGQGGTESTVDGRQNVLARKSLWVFVAVFLLAGFIGLFFAWKFFRPGHQSVVRNHGPVAPRRLTAGGSTHDSGGSGKGPATSDKWRIAGQYAIDGRWWVVLADADSRLRVESPSEFMGSGIAQVGTVEGERVATWSGVLRSGPAPAAVAAVAAPSPVKGNAK